MAIAFAVVADEDGFRRLEPEWRALSDVVDQSHLFQTFDWCWHAWRSVASKCGRRLRILVGRAEGLVVMIWPLMIVGPFLRVLGADLFEFHDVLVRPDPRRQEWLEAALRAAKRLGGTALLLRDVRGDADLAGFLSQRQGICRSRRVGRTRFIRLDRYADWDEYFNSLPSHLKNDQARQWRRVGRLPSPAQFEVVREPSAQREVVRWLHREKVAWLAARGTPDAGMFGTALYLAFLENIVAEANRRDNVLVCRLASGEDTMAALIGFSNRDYFAFFMFAYAPKWASYSPGRLVMAEAIGWCMQRDNRTFDMLLGEEDYKSVWSSNECAVADYFVPLTPQGHAIAAWYRAGCDRWLTRPWARAVARCMPTPLRRVIGQRLRSNAGLLAEMQSRQ